MTLLKFVFLTLIILLIFFIISKNSNTHQPGSVVWKPTQGMVSSEEEQDIKQSLDAVAADPTNRDSYIEITSVEREGDWMMIYGADRPIDPDVYKTGTPAYLAHKVGDNWSVILQDDPKFCDLLSEMPKSLLSESGKAYFCGYDESSQ